MPDDRLPEALTAEGPLEPDKLIAALAKKRVVFIGERHDRYDHHLNQLAIIRRLYEIHPRMAIGLEMFQQPFQPYLDAHIAGKLDEREFLKKTEYFQRWGFDERLYRPILRFAREKGIALLALNVPREIVHKVAASGLESLNQQERVWVPPVIDKSDTAYRDRLKAIFKQHSQGNAENFEYFVEAQLLWDEAMAARAARYLREHPSYDLVILAGNGHLAYGSGIPNRLRRRVPVAMSIVLQGDRDTKDRQGADYRLLSQKRDLPPPGLLGVVLDRTSKKAPGLRVERIVPGGGAQKAGIQAQDRLLEIAGWPIESMEDVRLALLDRVPGDSVKVKIRRNREETSQDMTVDVVLQK